jgi:hypothetical protein
MTEENQTPPATAGGSYVKPVSSGVGAVKPGAPMKSAPSAGEEGVYLYETVMEAVRAGGGESQVRLKGMSCRCPKPCGGKWARVFDRSADGHSSTYCCDSCGGRWSVQTGGAFPF